MNTSSSLWKRLRYSFDNIMSKGPFVTILLLWTVSFFIIFFFTIILIIFNIKPDGDLNLNFFETFWMSTMRTLDPGTMGDDIGWSFRIIMLLVTTYGIVMLSTFIGLISNGILSKIQQLRKGRSKVLENGHILILGWSAKIHTIVSELVIANENQKNPVIVILADMDKVEMEDEIKEKIKSTKNTKIICRTGNPIDVTDLEIANPQDTKSIIILDKENVNSDAEIIKVILAITINRNKRKLPYHITAEIKDEKNFEVAQMVGKDEVELILSDEFISKIMVQTIRQSGLSVVYTDFLDFEGDEIYFYEEEALFNKTFRDALFAYADSAVIGLQFPDGKVTLNPPADTLIEPGTCIIAISEDDDTVIMSDKPATTIREELILEPTEANIGPEKTLILGWNHRTKLIIKELADYLHPGSKIKIVAEYDEPEDVIKQLNLNFAKISIEYTQANTTDKEVLKGLDIHEYNHLLLLSYQNTYERQEADAKTLITLLHLRNLAEHTDQTLNIVSEMLDAKNRELAKVTNADDFIISDNIISLLMSQVSENKYLMRVFEQLFQAEGSEVYLKSARDYVEIGKELDFYTVLEAALRKDEIAIGYRKMVHKRDEIEAYGIRLNPNKFDKIVFDPEDTIILFAEDD